MHEHTKVALVTGANKGIGFEIARQLARKGYRVIVAARDVQKGRTAVDRLSREGLRTELQVLDVSNPLDITNAVSQIEISYSRLDVLVNNAGISLDRDTPLSQSSIDVIRQTLETNVFGAILMTQAVIPLMRKNAYGRIVNLSTDWASLHYMADIKSEHGGIEAPAYRISKIALNMATALFARELFGTNILVNSACPGWVRTDMGTSRAPLSPAEGAQTPVWLATLPDDGPSGGFYRDRQQIPW